jgi:hypothetical protein
MPLYFEPGAKAKETGYQIYMGKDKYENEELIRWGWPEDVWFHVDDLSSAHVYLRQPKGRTIEDIPEKVVHTCCQLVKDNSISGCKQASVYVVYTPWENLRKEQRMDAGTIGFHDQKEVRRVKVLKDKDEIKRVTKTKTEDSPDLGEQRAERDLLETQRKKKEAKDKRVVDKEEEKRLKAEAEALSYDRLFELQNEEDDGLGYEATEGVEAANEYEEDFF